MENSKPDQQEILALFDREMRQEITYPDMRKDRLPWGVRFVRPAPGMSFIGYHHLDKDSTAAAIAEQIAFFKDCNQPFSWSVYAHDAPADLETRLVAQGFTPDDPAALMVVDLHEVQPILLKPTEVDIRRITRREQLGDVIQVLEQVWDNHFDWIWDRLGNHLEIQGYLSIYVAYVENIPTSVGWTYYHTGSHFASLFGGSTLTRLRGRGYYTAILAQRVQEAKQRGYRYLVVETTPLSQAIVSRYGFWQLSTAQDFIAPD